jgi:two-component system chemotaxis response regulator CheB
MPPSSAAAQLAVIGSSTGGAGALRILLGALPAVDAAVVVVQHMPAYINASLCRTLGGVSRMPVRLIRSGETLERGTVYVAPSEAHLYLRRNSVAELRTGEKVNFVCPAVDVAMQSVEPAPGGVLIGVVLTGMGKDGATGLLHMRRIGAATFAQDEASSTVYGMPKAAAEAGAVDSALPPERIALRLAELFSRNAST